jgi:GTP-binding protein Era
MEDVDAIIYVADATRSIGSEEKQVLQLMKEVTKPKLLFINKTDDRHSKEYVDTYRDLFEYFDAMIEGSAITGKNLDLVRDWSLEQLPEGDYLYPDFAVSNLTKEQQIAELIREKLFLRLREEVPYSTHVEVQKIEVQPDETIYIRAVIYTHSERYKGMIIGEGGRGVKEIGSSTRNELEAISGQHVNLQLTVETDRDWTKRLGE